MMPRLFVVCLCAVILLVVQAQPGPDGRAICRRMTERCNAIRPPLRPDQALTDLNRQCRVMRGDRTWRDLSRCQLTRAVCEITLVRCRQLTCKNLEDVIRGN